MYGSILINTMNIEQHKRLPTVVYLVNETKSGNKNQLNVI